MSEKTDFPAQYNPKAVEKKWYNFWLENKFFTPDLSSKKPRYCITIPPPNITGVLHMGHALNSTIQDIMIRFKKLQGYETLWVPGTDHASIATHNQIEKRLAKEGKTRFDLGRDEFLKLAWEWKEKHANIILEQLKTLGAACDWSRTRFTMDPDLSRAVREAFVRYYEKGLIYKGYYIVNWCPRCRTSISDLEVKYKETKTKLWFIKYPLKDNQEQCIVVATTRPETMLGDTALAVNPSDFRYKEFIGKTAIVPLVNREVPIIADARVDIEFGTGAVKVTPAHDPVDFELAKTHNLAFIKILDEDARVTKDAPPKYQGLTREEARDQILLDLETNGYLLKTEDYEHRVGRCARCDTITEPMISLQWFLKTKELAAPAIKKVEDGTVKFYPERWRKVYLDWMYNIKDWCISRQLWWGHRIPAFYCDDCGYMMVTRTDPNECSKCHSKNIRQDEDILDTWFSSALWPFSVLGWPEDTQDLREFYPTNFLSTDPDIIFLWVARMIMSGLEFLSQVPFYDVYIHSTILTETGERMSRSKGIGVDPVILIDKYGACALRFTLAYLETESQTYRFWEKRVELGRNFANKIWNAGRLVKILLEASEAPLNELQIPLELTNDFTLIDRWFISKYKNLVIKVTSSLERYQFSLAAQELYEFFWHQFCDWYLEFCKIRKRNGDNSFANCLYNIFKGLLVMLHPFMPFITEELWHKFSYPEKSILLSSWPTPPEIAQTSQEDFITLMCEIITALRSIRSEMRLPINKPIDCLVNTSSQEILNFLLKSKASLIIKELAKINEIKQTDKRPPNSSTAVLKDLEVYVPLSGLIDIEKEKDRIKKEILELETLLNKTNVLLGNPQFLEKAKLEVVEQEKVRQKTFEEKLKRLKAILVSLE
ncbi:MAG: valine--tRNA ligase [candidate division WOR-3 bacterium]|nr:valine--tRNA ligase [candidate division WOR-3 bacterium]